MKRRILVLAGLAAILSSHAARAQPAVSPPKYAVLSLIGEKFNLVTTRLTTGSHLDYNFTQSVSLPGAPFDITALSTIQDSVKSATGQQEVLLYTTALPDLFNKQLGLFDGSRLVLPPELLATMKKDGANLLLLLTRHRQDATLAVREGYIGNGRMEGIGYYVDRQTRLERTDTSEKGNGFLAAFLYLQLSLVDLGDARVLRQQHINASTVLPTAGKRVGFDPWEVLSPQEKLNELDRMIKTELKQAVPQIIEHN
jgi:hypothetical protein